MSTCQLRPFRVGPLLGVDILCTAFHFCVGPLAFGFRLVRRSHGKTGLVDAASTATAARALLLAAGNALSLSLSLPSGPRSDSLCMPSSPTSSATLHLTLTLDRRLATPTYMATILNPVLTSFSSPKIILISSGFALSLFPSQPFYYTIVVGQIPSLDASLLNASIQPTPCCHLHPFHRVHYPLGNKELRHRP